MADLTSPRYTDRYLDALAWSARLHANQGRKADEGAPVTVPYVAHLLEVSALVWLGGGDEDQAIAGLLHDALEDTDATYVDVARRYGDRVADLVQACTDGTPRSARDRTTWFGRKVAYLCGLYADDHTDALLVTVADKVSNARSIVDDLVAADGDPVATQAVWDRFHAGREAVAWYYVEVHRAVVAQQPDNGLLSRLEPLVAQVLDAAGGMYLRSAVEDDPDEIEDALARLDLLQRSVRARPT